MSTGSRSGSLPSMVDLGIELAVFDCAGTTIDEGSIVYSTLSRTLVNNGITPTEEEFNEWHGADKVHVLRHFATTTKVQQGVGDADGGGDEDAREVLVQKMFKEFLAGIEAAYFDSDTSAGNVKVMDGSIELFDKMRKAGIKVALNTGYPRAVADRLVAKLGLEQHIDGIITAEEVGQGRPYPYMIHALMRKFGLMDVRKVAKIGDTVRDIQEGLNAGCGLVIGVLSGADKQDALEKAGAHYIIPTVAQLRI